MAQALAEPVYGIAKAAGDGLEWNVLTLGDFPQGQSFPQFRIWQYADNDARAADYYLKYLIT